MRSFSHLDFIFSVQRWLGFEGLTNPAGLTYDALSFCAALASITKNINSCFKFYAEYINAFNNDVGKAREVLFGGVNSLRGYDNNLFRSPYVSIPTFEFHYNGIKSFNSLVFFECGFSKNYKPKLSYGFGVKKITNNALINIEYAIPHTAQINEAKVHIKWLTRL